MYMTPRFAVLGLCKLRFPSQNCNKHKLMGWYLVQCFVHLQWHEVLLSLPQSLWMHFVLVRVLLHAPPQTC